jgi:hypothetical protein
MTIFDTTWTDPNTKETFIWSELEHNALDDLVKGITNQEINHFGWVPLLKGYLGQSLLSSILDEVNFSQLDDDE